MIRLCFTKIKTPARILILCAALLVSFMMPKVSVAGNAIPAQLGSLPTGLVNQLASVSNIGKMSPSQLQGLMQQVSGPLGQSLLAAANGPNNVQNVVNQLTQIAQIALAPSAFSDPSKIAQQLAQGLISAGLPKEISQILSGLLGGPGGIEKALNEALKGTTGGTNSGGTGGTGKKPSSNSSGGCSGCGECANCPKKINLNHENIRAHESAEFESHRSWIVTTWWIELVAPALGAMTSQFTANMMLQVEAIGAFFDAKHQMESQRIFQHMTAKAHKDYHPSEELCAIGTNSRSLASSERKSNLVHTTLSNRMMQRQLSIGDNISTEGRNSDRRTRLKEVVEKYCRPSDNGGDFKNLCKATDKARMNMDVDFTAAVTNKLTLELDYSQGKESAVTEDEENIFALAANPFWTRSDNPYPKIKHGTLFY